MGIRMVEIGAFVRPYYPGFREDTPLIFERRHHERYVVTK